MADARQRSRAGPVRFAHYKRMAAVVAFFRRAETFTHAEVQMALGLKRTAVGALLRELWRPGPHRALRICAWREDRLGRPTVRVYEFGNGPDEKRRPPKDMKTRQVAYLERKARRSQLLTQDVFANMVRDSR